MRVDLKPATDQLCALVANVPDDALGGPTPCDFSVGALLDHLGTFAVVFTDAANKVANRPTGRPPAPDAAHLAAEWRASIPRDLARLATAWSMTEAWAGTTKIRGMDMPGEAVGVIALDEIVLHGWDLARATNQPYDADPEVLDVLMGFLSHMDEPGMAVARDGIFGPVVKIADDASLLDRVLGLAGRDPNWTPR